PFLFAGDRHQAALCLHDEIVARPGGFRTGLSVARDRTIDQPRIAAAQRLPAYAQPSGDAGAKVLDDDICPARQRATDLDALELLEVQCHALLAAIGAQEIGADALVIGDAPGTRVVAAVDVLYLPDLSAEIGEAHRRPWS